MNKYLFLLTVQDADEDGMPTNDVCTIEAFTLESLQEQLSKVEHAIKDYEGKMEAMAQAAADLALEQEAEAKAEAENN